MFFIKKNFIIFLLIAVIFTFSLKSDTIVIPDSALRFRVIANSNSIEDQRIKIIVKEELEKEIYTFLKEANNIVEAKKLLDANMDILNNNTNLILEKNDFNYGYSINLGLNKFPPKEYKGIIYKEGEYESLVVTLGKGEGNNWWCVLFPPLCLLEAEEKNTEKVEYQFFVKKILAKYMK